MGINARTKLFVIFAPIVIITLVWMTPRQSESSEESKLQEETHSLVPSHPLGLELSMDYSEEASLKRLDPSGDQVILEGPIGGRIQLLKILEENHRSYYYASFQADSSRNSVFKLKHAESILVFEKPFCLSEVMIQDGLVQEFWTRLAERLQLCGSPTDEVWSIEEGIFRERHLISYKWLSEDFRSIQKELYLPHLNSKIQLDMHVDGNYRLVKGKEWKKNRLNEQTILSENQFEFRLLGVLGTTLTKNWQNEVLRWRAKTQEIRISSDEELTEVEEGDIESISKLHNEEKFSLDFYFKAKSWVKSFPHLMDVLHSELKTMDPEKKLFKAWIHAISAVGHQEGQDLLATLAYENHKLPHVTIGILSDLVLSEDPRRSDKAEKTLWSMVHEPTINEASKNSAGLALTAIANQITEQGDEGFQERYQKIWQWAYDGLIHAKTNEDLSYYLSALGNTGDARLPSIVAPYLNHSDYRVRRDAIASLALIDSQDSFTVLWEILISAKSIRIQKTAARSLEGKVFLNSKRVLQLFHMIRNSENEDLRLSLYKLLFSIQDNHKESLQEFFQERILVEDGQIVKALESQLGATENEGEI